MQPCDDGSVVRCSFCGKGRDEVVVLIANAPTAICDECVDLCLDILVERRVYRVLFPRLWSVGRRVWRALPFT